jgi:hypothetical protein
MPDWLDQFLKSVFADARRTPPRFLHRRIRIAGEVRAWLEHPDRTQVERLGFAELLFRVDRNPVGEETHPILGPGRPPGVRCADSGVVRMMYEWNPAENRLRIAKCARST